MVEWNRNLSRISKVKGKKIVIKKHKKRIFLQRELFFYNLFRKYPLIKTPKIYDSGKLDLQTYFIETENKNILQTAREWAKVHSYFIENPLEDNHLLMHHDIQEVMSHIFKNLAIFGEMGPIIRNKLYNVKVNKNLITVLHGDLQQKNTVTSHGNNYYFDFELGGTGNPGRDLASMIISNPDEKESLITTYRQNFDFDYEGMGRDIGLWSMTRTAQLYLIIKKRDGTKEQKKKAVNKLSKIIHSL